MVNKKLLTTIASLGCHACLHMVVREGGIRHQETSSLNAINYILPLEELMVAATCLQDDIYPNCRTTSLGVPPSEEGDLVYY